MLYAFLCYNDEDDAFSRTQAEDAAVMRGLSAVHTPLEMAGRFAAGVQLMPTTTAATVRMTLDLPVVLDGPCGATKQQQLGLYVVDCKDLEAALAVAWDLARVDHDGAYEMRPLRAHLAARGQTTQIRLLEQMTARTRAGFGSHPALALLCGPAVPSGTDESGKSTEGDRPARPPPRSTS